MKLLKNVCFCNPKDLKFFKKYLANWSYEGLIFKTTPLMPEWEAEIIDFKKEQIYYVVPSLNPKLTNMHKKN